MFSEPVPVRIRILCLALLLFVVQPGLLSAREYRPPYPRLVFQRPGGIAGGAVQYFFSRYDLAIHGGGGIFAYALNDSIHALNPHTIILGTSRQGIWPGNPVWPPACFIYSSWFDSLRVAAQPGDTQIRVKSTAGFKTNAINDDIYALVGADDWISFTGFTDTTIYGIPVSGDYALNIAHAIGDTIKRPSRFQGFGYLHNVTAFAPLIGSQPVWAYFVDQRFNAAKQDFSRFDGIFYDSFRFFFWGDDFQSTIDLDYNHLDDLSESGKGLAWFNTQWAEGVKQMMPYERGKFAALHPGQPVVVAVNMGAAQEGDPYPMRYCDGMEWEGFMRFAYTAPELIRVNQLWDAAHDTVYTMIEDNVMKPNQSMDYKRIRYGLSAALMSGAYYGMTYGNEYSMSLWYDEFDLELGYPTGSAHPLPGLSGVYVRFFDKGAAICNASGQIVTVTNAMLAGMPGYQGPYWRFLGGQKPSINNGQPFTSIELWGETQTPAKNNIGDGILLLSHPDTVVADILVGTCYFNDTSPGSARAQFDAGFHKVPDHGNENVDIASRNRCFSQWVASDSSGIGYYYSSPAETAGWATFRPTIGVAGWYEISEWHPMVGETASAYQEANDMPFEAVVAGTKKLSGIIDQTKNYGRWNRIAILWLPAGTDSYVRISNRCNGFIAADAMRFRYLKRVVPDVTPPRRPADLRLVR
ncbi:MAG TPA: putative glycoside hydrolase [bacterium]|nr:putative glycoside hydrolase [bacterium]